MRNLKDEIDLKEIDYIIIQHAEIDHSGALRELMREVRLPSTATNNGRKIIQGHFHEDWNFVTVKTGDTLDIGESTLTFVEAPMLHWPDTMFTYMSGETSSSATMPLASTILRLSTMIGPTPANCMKKP